MNSGLLDRSNLYMLPTRHGALFAFVLLAMLLIAVNYANTLAYLMTFLLVALVMVSMLYTHLNLSGLEVSTGRCQATFAGQPLHYQVCLHNPSSRERHDIGLDIEGQPGQRFNIRPGEVICIPCEMLVRRRGWHALPAIQVNTRYPLGLMFSWSRGYKTDQKCLVYPAPGKMTPFPPGQGGSLEDSGARRGTGHDDFAGLREYRAGDALQHVDWKAYARGMGLHTKEFASGRSPELEFDWQDTQGDTEMRISQLTRWVLEADRLGARYALTLPGRKLQRDSGEQHLERCLKELALF